MMKRNILAVVIPALLAAGAANAAEVYNKDGNKLDLYGRVTALHYFADDNSQNSDGDQTYARLGFKGETQINDLLTGYGRFEYQFNGSQPESTSGTADKTRFAFAGLKYGDFGSFDYGRNLGIVYDGLSYTDVLPEFGGDSTYTDNLTQRVTGVATYRNSNFFGLVDGLSFGLQYQGKNEGSRAINKQNGDGWGTSLAYESEIGIGATASYGSYDRTNLQQQGGEGSRAEAWATGLKYDANNVYLAATYGQYRNLTYVGAANTAYADKTKVFEAVAQYTFDFGLTPSLAYVSSKAKDDSNGNNAYVTKYVSVAATYAFNKNISTYVEYDINLIDSDKDTYSAGTDDTVAVGLVYQF